MAPSRQGPEMSTQNSAYSAFSSPSRRGSHAGLAGRTARPSAGSGLRRRRLRRGRLATRCRRTARRRAGRTTQGRVVRPARHGPAGLFRRRGRCRHAPARRRNPARPAHRGARPMVPGFPRRFRPHRPRRQPDRRSRGSAAGHGRHRPGPGPAGRQRGRRDGLYGSHGIPAGRSAAAVRRVRQAAGARSQAFTALEVSA